LTPLRSYAELTVLTLLRIAVGWHFAYEGLSKLMAGNWTAAGYLANATGPAAGVFHWMASNAAVLKVVDLLNMWGLLLLGLLLMLGFFTRVSALLGVGLLALYYISYPPLFAEQVGVSEGSYLIVNKNLVELIALCVVAVLPCGRFGLDGVLFGGRVRKKEPETGIVPSYEQQMPGSSWRVARRQLLAGMVSVPFIGAFVLAVLKKHGYASQEEKHLADYSGTSGATMKPFELKTARQVKGKMPTAKIGGVEFSRVIMGGNLMNGFAHARDLIYVSKLIRAYHHQAKIFETLRLAEECGVNTILTNPMLAPMINQYWERGIGKIKFIAQCKGKNETELLENVRYSISFGACAAYIQGAAADSYVSQGRFDWMAKALDVMRDKGLPAGIGGHHIATIRGSVDHGFEPDFWMKTLHHHDYWSARPQDQHDNMWCEDPGQTIAFMNDLPQPWIAFKVLAAGSIEPRVGFKYAFQNGADFICVGMYDFQVVEDVNVAVNVLSSKLERQRPWRA
jgi:uncharacterized membrane protein YphA (DoxX/SURF4 family)